MSDCICEGNWRDIIKECEPLLNKWFVNKKGKKFMFIGVMNGFDDYYYCLSHMSTGVVEMPSCVGSLEQWGYSQVELVDGEWKAVE